MKRKIGSFFSVLLLIFGFFLLTAQSNCDGTNTQQVSKSGARVVSDIIKVPLNANGNTVEQQQIMDRIRVTNDPTKVMWIHLIALDGTIVTRMPVRNKVTSSGKRLEPKHAADSGGWYPDAPFNMPGSQSHFETDEFIQPDGTFGDSDPYIFWFDPPGRYHQLGTAGGMAYLKTDYPIDLRNPRDTITGLYNMEQKAWEWQKQQEEVLRKKEAENRSAQ